MEHFEKFASTLPDFPLLATEFDKRTEWDSTWSQTAALIRRRRIGLLQVLEITKKLQDRQKHQWRHDHPCSFSMRKHRSTDHGENTSARASSGNLEVGSTEFSFSNNATPQFTVCLLRLLLAALPLPCHCTRSRDQSGGGYLKWHRNPRRHQSGYKYA
jgi:hypothetical protein